MGRDHAPVVALSGTPPPLAGPTLAKPPPRKMVLPDGTIAPTLPCTTQYWSRTICAFAGDAINVAAVNPTKTCREESRSARPRAEDNDKTDSIMTPSVPLDGSSVPSSVLPRSAQVYTGGPTDQG